jgi:hypothetical protein
MWSRVCLEIYVLGFNSSCKVIANVILEGFISQVQADLLASSKC